VREKCGKTVDHPYERMIRIARLPSALRPVSIYTGDPPAPISCEWLGVAHVNDGPPADPETYILYFMDGRGVPQEMLQYDTLEIAVDQAHAICGFSQEGWSGCDIAVRDDGSYDVARLKDAMC
jgi:hypothetical protein